MTIMKIPEARARLLDAIAEVLLPPEASPEASRRVARAIEALLVAVVCELIHAHELAARVTDFGKLVEHVRELIASDLSPEEIAQKLGFNLQQAPDTGAQEKVTDV